MESITSTEMPALNQEFLAPWGKGQKPASLASMFGELPLSCRERRVCGPGACGPRWSGWMSKNGPCPL